MGLKDRERRSAPRHAVELNVAIRHLGRPEESRADVARNLGAGGVFVETSVGLPLGTAVVIEVSVAGDRLSVEGEVVRVEWEGSRARGTSERRVRGLAFGFRPGQHTVDRLLRRVERLVELAAVAEEVEVEGEA